ncbi:hypothetical protein ACFWP3_22770 [Streptomyces sp. NPDC058525]
MKRATVVQMDAYRPTLKPVPVDVPVKRQAAPVSDSNPFRALL